MRPVRARRTHRSPQQRVIILGLALVMTLFSLLAVDFYAQQNPVEDSAADHALFALLPAGSAGKVVHGPLMAGLVQGEEVMRDSLRAQRELVQRGHDPRKMQVFLLAGDSRRDSAEGHCLRPLRVIRAVNQVVLEK